jgi:hypothetical protein
MIVKVTPTPSNTPSNTPTITPSVSSCPTYGWITNIKLFECNYGQTYIGLPLTGWTMEHSGITYSALTQYTGIEAATWCNVPVQEPFVGASYIFNLTTISPGWELCNQSAPISVYWDSFEVILTSYAGRTCYTLEECVLEYNATINYYLNGVLQVSQGEIIQFTEYLISENASCSPAFTMFNQVMMFVVDIIRTTPTPTPTVTSTVTPSPTYCYNPQAYAIFDSNSDRLNLRDWMISQGSTWRGFNSVPAAPSTTQSIFEAQMNAYISYTGFTVGNNNALMAEPVSNNEDPITIFNSNTWSSDFTWVSIITPVCALCPEGEFDYISDVSFNYLAADVYKSMIFYYSGNAITQGYYRFYTTYNATGMRQFNSTSFYNVNTLVCPATPTPTTTSTPTRTPSITQTQTNTMTPTVSCAVPTLYLASTSNDACNQINGQFLTNISHTDSFVCPYCSWTTLNSTEIPFLTNGTYYVSDGINVRSWTKTSTPSVLYNPSACSSCPVTPTPTQTNTATPTTTCACYSFTNTTETTGEVYYTSCLGNSPTTSSVNAGLTITFCAVYGQPVTATSGTIGGLCAGFVQPCADDSNCSACGSNTQTPTPTYTSTPTPTYTSTPTVTPFVIVCETGLIEGSYSGLTEYTYPNQPISSSVDEYNS